jgi:hypothetical protein
MNPDTQEEKLALYQAAILMLIHENAAFWNRQGVFGLANSIIITAIFLPPQQSPILMRIFRSGFGILTCVCWLVLAWHGLWKAHTYHEATIKMEEVAKQEFLLRLKRERRWFDEWWVVPLLAIGMIVIFLFLYILASLHFLGFIETEGTIGAVTRKSFRGALNFVSWRNVLSFLIGGLITFIVSWFSYMRAGKDLKKEAEELRKINTLILRGLEQQGVDFSKDQEGNITGIMIKLKADIRAKSSTSQPELNAK